MMFRTSIGVRAFGALRLGGVRANSTAPGLSWVDFFKLRKQNNRINVGFSVVTSAAGALATLGYLGNLEIDAEKPIFGLDPFMVLGGAVIMGGGFAYLLGPFFGTSVFNLMNKRALQQFKAKDKVFLQKIKANRVDPSSQSFSNPVPDYYGERIYSLKDYKQWLTDCNAYRRKTKEFL